jgi:hypothetical protein
MTSGPMDFAQSLVIRVEKRISEKRQLFFRIFEPRLIKSNGFLDSRTLNTAEVE